MPSMWSLLSSSFCTRYESNGPYKESAYPFLKKKSQPFRFLWEDAQNTYTQHCKNLSRRRLHDNITYRRHHIPHSQHDSKIILKNKTDLHLDRQFSTIDRQKRTTTKEYTIMELNGHPTLDGSKERVAWMENPEKQTHVLNQDYGVVPSVATSALWRNLI